VSLIKVCGMTRREDVRAAVDAGADLVGFLFAESPRRIDPERARDLRRELSGTAVRAVGVFCNEDLRRVREIAESVPLDTVQLHGDEDHEYAAAVGHPVIRAISVRSAGDWAGWEEYPAELFLLDADHPGRRGGTGTTFDWDLLTGAPFSRPFLLAGGLHPGNVAEAIERVRPFGVDVSSGVEAAPGIKSDEKIRKFIEEARRAWAKERS